MDGDYSLVCLIVSISLMTFLVLFVTIIMVAYNISSSNLAEFNTYAQVEVFCVSEGVYSDKLHVV